MSWIILAISLAYEVLKLIFLIRNNTKHLPKVRQVFYKRRCRELQMQHKGDQKTLLAKLQELNNHVSEEKTDYIATVAKHEKKFNA